MKRVALFGGSFNPPHTGHFDMAKYIHETLKVDEIWFLFSENWQKANANYAPSKQRMEMGDILAKHYPNLPFVMSDIQDQLGTHITFEVLSQLKEKFADTRFIWIMGADNLANFHTWKHSDDIIQNFLTAVVDRPPYTEEALSSATALKFAFLKAANPEKFANMDKGWIFLDNPKIDISSSDLLKQLKSGRMSFNNAFQEVADYIKEHS